jgi:hypothetical protein
MKKELKLGDRVQVSGEAGLGKGHVVKMRGSIVMIGPQTIRVHMDNGSQYSFMRATAVVKRLVRKKKRRSREIWVNEFEGQESNYLGQRAYLSKEDANSCTILHRIRSVKFVEALDE